MLNLLLKSPVKKYYDFLHNHNHFVGTTKIFKGYIYKFDRQIVLNRRLISICVV